MPLYPITKNKTTTPSLDCIRNQIMELQKNSEQSFLKIGELLLQAKNTFGKHGDWLAWLNDNVDMSISKAQRLMKIAKLFSKKEPVPFLTYSKAYILTALPESEIDTFLSVTHYLDSKHLHVRDMSKRELEAVVRKHINSRRTKIGSAQSLSKLDSSAISEDILTSCVVNIKNSLKTLLEHIHSDVPSLYNTLFSELRDLCNEVIEQLPLEETENT